MPHPDNREVGSVLEDKLIAYGTQDPLDDLRRRATVTVPQAAAVLGISKETAYRWAREGTLPGVIRLGRSLVRVKTADLIALLDQG
jgi:excisionase family DNA binding protein